MLFSPTENFVHAAVQHISQASSRVGVTMDTHLFLSALATEEDQRQLWKAGPALQRPDAGAAALRQHSARWTRPRSCAG